jgi:hypothetical protein
MDRRDMRSAEEAAAETEEPEEATRLRAEDDAETRARQNAAEAGLKAADRALESGEARLRQTRAELHQREKELERTSDLTKEVARNAADLQTQTSQISEVAHRVPLRAEPPIRPAGSPTETDS